MEVWREINVKVFSQLDRQVVNMIGMEQFIKIAL
jgi:hypothetical protein